MEDDPEIMTGREAIKRTLEELRPIRFYSTVWRHSRKWAIPIPKGVREMVSLNQLYLIKIEFITPDDWNLRQQLGHILTKVDYESYGEVTKVWKSGKRLLFPITMNTARRLVPKLQELKEATEMIIEEATIQEAIDYLLKTDPEYKELRRKLIRLNTIEPYALNGHERRQLESIQKKIAKLREEYRPKAEELVKEGFKPSPKVELIKDWIKNPLLITATPYIAKNEREAIALYRRAPMPADETEFL